MYPTEDQEQKYPTLPPHTLLPQPAKAELVRDPVTSLDYAMAYLSKSAWFIRLHWKRLALGSVALGSVGTLGAFYLASTNQGEGKVNTPAVGVIRQQQQQQSNKEILDQATLIIIGKPLTFPTPGVYAVLGTPTEISETSWYPSDPKVIALASSIVLDYQKAMLLNAKAIELTGAIDRGIDNPDHQCYMMRRDECIAKLQEGAQIEINDAVARNDLDKQQAYTFFNAALDAIKNGSVVANDYSPELLNQAQMLLRDAQGKIQASSASGIAGEIQDAKNQISSDASMLEIINRVQEINRDQQ